MYTHYRYVIKHSGVGHEDDPPGRGSGRYPYGSGDRPYQDREPAKSEKVKKAVKSIGRIAAKSVLLGATVAARAVFSSAITSATLVGIAAVGFNFITSPEVSNLIGHTMSRAGKWFFDSYVKSTVSMIDGDLDKYLMIGETYLKSLDV